MVLNGSRRAQIGAGAVALLSRRFSRGLAQQIRPKSDRLLARALALLGLALPLASTVLHSDSLGGMLMWASVALLVQILVYCVCRRRIPDLDAGITAGRMAHAVLLARLALCLGAINAACVS